MKHAICVMLLAGMAGGTAWYRSDQDSSPAFSKLQIPDPGPDENALDLEEVSVDKPRDVQLMEPVEDLPTRYIAERPTEAFTVSDEQPFAVSGDDNEEDATPIRKTSVPHTDAFEPIETESSPVAKTEKAKAAADQSVEGRPLVVRRLGQGKFRTVIITGLDGRDLTAVEWADDLAAALEQRTDLLAQQEFVIIRAANPDGLAAKIRENARGIELNRNFPTRRFQAGEKTAGIGPASEPETRMLLQSLYEARPQRVVHLCSTSGKSGVYINQQAGDVAERLQRHYGLPVERMNYDHLPGSVEEFTDTTWNASVVRLHLRGVPEEDVVRKLIPVVLTAVAARDVVPPRTGTIAPVSTPRREQSRWQTGPSSSPVPTRPGYQTERRSRPPLHRGYEELPPPPQ